MFDVGKVGSYITLLRKNKRLTQGKLADALGISHQAVSNWERGESMPDISILPALAKSLGASVDKILDAGSENFTGFDEIIEKIDIKETIHTKEPAINEEEVEEIIDTLKEDLSEQIEVLEMNALRLKENLSQYNITLNVITEKQNIAGNSSELSEKLKAMHTAVTEKIAVTKVEAEKNSLLIKELKEKLSIKIRTDADNDLIEELLKMPGLEDFN